MKDASKNPILIAVLNGIERGGHSEYVFFPYRKWRFDWAWPHLKIAVEVNGQAWGTKGGGRHGKDADLQKMNCAQRLGWRVFQYSTNIGELARMKAELTECIGKINGTLEGKLDLVYSIDKVRGREMNVKRKTSNVASKAKQAKKSHD